MKFKENDLSGRFYIFIILIVGIFTHSYSNNLDLRKYDSLQLFSISLEVIAKSGSSFYTKDGDVISERERDSSYSELDASYTFNFNSYTFAIEGNYNITPNLIVNASIPFSFYQYRETDFLKEYDTVTINGQDFINDVVYRNELPGISLIQIEYIEAGVSYFAELEPIRAGLGFFARFPVGSETGILNSKEVWYDGHTELILAGGIEAMVSTTSFGNVLSVHSRNEGFSDQLLWKPYIVFRSVENTDLILKGNFAFNLGNEVDFIYDPKYPSYAETYNELGIAVWLDIIESLQFDLGYNIRLEGLNSLNHGTFYLKITSPFE